MNHFTELLAFHALPRHEVRDVLMVIASFSLQAATQCCFLIRLCQERTKQRTGQYRPRRLATLRDIAKDWLEAGTVALARALKDGLIEEIADDRKDSEED